MRYTPPNFQTLAQMAFIDVCRLTEDQARVILEHIHQVVNHGAGEYARGDANTNTAESYFALLKRGVMGTFHHISKQHLFRYCDEFSFRWNNRKVSDGKRTENAIKGFVGKRLVYRAI